MEHKTTEKIRQAIETVHESRQRMLDVLGPTRQVGNASLIISVLEWVIGQDGGFGTFLQHVEADNIKNRGPVQ